MPEGVTREQAAAQLATQLIVFADGAEEAGLVKYAQRARVVAQETIWLAGQLQLERTANQALRARLTETWRILANRVFCRGCHDALKKAA